MSQTKTRRVNLTLDSVNRAAALYKREGWKQRISVPIGMFEGDAPAELHITSTFAAEAPKKVRTKSKLRQMLAGLDDERRKAVRKAMREARANVLREAGLAADTAEADADADAA